jgi:hypothetical protein
MTAGMQEAQTNKVKISADEFSPELVDCVISFIYSGCSDICKDQPRPKRCSC